MVSRAVNGNKGRIKSAGAPALSGIGGHDSHLDINLPRKPRNAPLHQRCANWLELNSFRCAKICIAALLLASGKNCSDPEQKHCQKFTVICHGRILPFSFLFGKIKSCPETAIHKRKGLHMVEPLSKAF